MSNSKGSTNVRNLMYSGGKHALLPPKSPFPSVSPPYADYALTPSAIGPPSKAVQKPVSAANAVTTHQHQRRSSESLIAEEQPSWLDDLLNEPETPVRRGSHRRSSSDSFAYADSFSNNEIAAAAQAQDDYNYKFKNVVVPAPPSWGPSQDFDPRHGSFFAEMNMARQKNGNNRAWEGSLSNSAAIPSSGAKDGLVRHGSGSFCVPQDQLDGFPSTANEKYDGAEAGPHDPRNAEKNSGSRPSSSDTDTKRAKQQFAQRSRVRKLQYIAELERNVQALQAEGSEVSAELEFLNQQNLILNMENKALKQRLESLAQEHLIKHLEHEVLEREIGRLRSLYQQQAQPQASSHRRSNSRDLDSQFSNLSLKHKDPNSGRDGQLRI